MFSGLIAHLGTVYAARPDPRGGLRLIVACAGLAGGAEPKDSVAVNGVCLTVVARNASMLTFDVVPQTLQCSTLGMLREGSPVNIELSLRLGDRLGGHLVYGHVDATALIVSKEPEGQGHRLILSTPSDLARYIVEKGYVSLDGVSLTVAAVKEGRFEAVLIPETSARTTLGSKGPGEGVNVEIDPIARYVLAGADVYMSQASGSEELAWAYEI